MENYIEYKIVNGIISNKNIEDNIIYCPNHAKGDLGHPDVEYGKVSTVDERGVFVRFVGPNGAKCRLENLYW